MSLIKEHRINNCIVNPVPVDAQTKEDLKPIRGCELFSELYCNAFLLAKKKSGKTTLLYKIVKECTDPRTKVFAFVSTVNKDKTYSMIKKYCKSKDIEFQGFTSLTEDGENILQTLVEQLQKEKPEDEEEEDKPKMKSIILCDSDEEDKPKKRKYKYRVPEYLFILDDLSTELNTPAVTALLKKNRHFKSKIIISNQYWNDLSKSGRKNLDYMIIFGAQPKEKMLEMHKELDLSTSFDKFYEIYKYATEERYNFLYIDVVNEEYRRNFNIKLTI